MSLESAEWRDRGPASPRTGPPTVGDRIARIAALLILVAIFAFSAFAISFAAFAINIVVGIMVVGLVFALFRLRELGRKLEEQRALLEQLRAPPAAPKEPEKPA